MQTFINEMNADAMTSGPMTQDATIPDAVTTLDSVFPAHLPRAALFFGRTPAMQAVRRAIERVAATDVAVLIQGESGTGKDVCAAVIHAASHRARGPLVRVSCPAIPASLLESELFGYDKGAFTGANSSRPGRLEQADRGTVVLDELESLDLAMQSKLLEFLQDGSFTRVGGGERRTLSTRVLSIAKSDLRRRVDQGAFRLDLLFRVNAVTLELPPLRQRQEDLPELIAYFAEQHARTFELPPRPISKDLLQLMQEYAWPGNIRQLDNLVRSYVLIGDEQKLVDELLPTPPTAGEILEQIDLRTPISLRQITRRATRELERQIILKVLQANGWNRSKAARWLQISPRSLFYKLGEAPPAPLTETTNAAPNAAPAPNPAGPGPMLTL